MFYHILHAYISSKILSLHDNLPIFGFELTFEPNIRRDTSLPCVDLVYYNRPSIGTSNCVALKCISWKPDPKSDSISRGSNLTHWILDSVVELPMQEGDCRRRRGAPTIHK